MITATIAALCIFGGQAEKWELKAPLTKDAKTVYAVQAEVVVMGESHTVKFVWTTTLGEKATDQSVAAKVLWNGIEVDGNARDDESPWTFKLDQRGAVLIATGGLDDDYRRMMIPLFFVYPDKGVAVGDKWEAKVGPKETYTYQFEAKGLERVKNDDTIKIAGSFKEGEKGMSGDGIWWVGKTGTIAKFELKIKGWVMPFTSDPGESIEITMKGSNTSSP